MTSLTSPPCAFCGGAAHTGGYWHNAGCPMLHPDLSDGARIAAALERITHTLERIAHTLETMAR